MRWFASLLLCLLALLPLQAAPPLADGQVAAGTPASILAGSTSGEQRITATFANTSASLTETLTIQYKRGAGTARRIAQIVLKPNESCVLSGFPMGQPDTLLAGTTDATTVDYTIASLGTQAAIAQSLTVYDANGAVKGSSNPLLGGKVYAATAASAAISNTTSETLFSNQYSIPANTLAAGTVVKIRLQGIQTAQNSTNTLAIKVYIGGTSGTALVSIAAAQGATSNIFDADIELVVRTNGSSGTFVATSTYTAVPAAAGTATRVEGITASTAIDTTAAQLIGVSATWSAASTGNSVRLDVLDVSIFP